MKSRQVMFRVNERESEMINQLVQKHGYRISELFRIGLRKIYNTEIEKKEDSTE